VVGVVVDGAFGLIKMLDGLPRSKKKTNEAARTHAEARDKRRGIAGSTL